MQLAAVISLPHNPAADSAEDRRSERTRLIVDGQVQDGDRSLHPLVIRDLSVEGLAGECAAPIAVGEMIDVQVGAHPARQACVLRREGDTMAALFTMPLTHAELNATVAQSPVVWGDFIPSTSADRAPLFEGLGEADAETAERWPGMARVAVIAGGAAALWGGILLAVL